MGNVVFGTDSVIAASSIRFATALKRAGYSPMVANMGLVVIVEAVGHEGETGMDVRAPMRR